MDFVDRLEGRFLRGEALSKHSTWRVGGDALVWAELHDCEELRAFLELSLNEGWTVDVVGLGSNVLFSDDGVDGAVIRLSGELSKWAVVEETTGSALVRVGAGCVNAHLVRGLLKKGLVGMEFLGLIPGTFGGAVAMNAGTKEGELSSILAAVETARTSAPGDVVTLDAGQIEMGYRHVKLEPGTVIVGGTIRVTKGDALAAAERLKGDKERRNRTQPYRLASVGSTFANPPGDFAGRLIEEVGLKGTKVGGARISPLHANFFVNEGGATAREFLTLMAMARVRVRERFGVELRPEVRFVGFDGWAQLRDLERDAKG